MKVFNRRDLKERRKELRNNLTEPERLLWNKLRHRQIQEAKFRRQHSIGSYVADFYNPSLKLVIELDGDSHFQKDAEKYDENRTTYFKSLGCTVIRFTNTEITQNLNGVLEEIILTITNIKAGNPT